MSRTPLVVGAVVALATSTAFAAGFDINEATDFADISSGSVSIEDCTDGVLLDVVPSTYQPSADDWLVDSIAVTNVAGDLGSACGGFSVTAAIETTAGRVPVPGLPCLVDPAGLFASQTLNTTPPPVPTDPNCHVSLAAFDQGAPGQVTITPQPGPRGAVVETAALVIGTGDASVRLPLAKGAAPLHVADVVRVSLLVDFVGLGGGVTSLKALAAEAEAPWKTHTSPAFFATTGGNPPKLSPTLGLDRFDSACQLDSVTRWMAHTLVEGPDNGKAGIVQVGILDGPAGWPFHEVFLANVTTGETSSATNGQALPPTVLVSAGDTVLLGALWCPPAPFGSPVKPFVMDVLTQFTSGAK